MTKTPQDATPRPKAPAPRPKPGRPVTQAGDRATAPDAGRAVELGGPSGPEPTRYGDWERNGRCTDF